MTSTSTIARDTVIAILKRALDDGLVQRPSDRSDDGQWEPRALPESALAGCMTALFRSTHRSQIASTAGFHDDLLALLDRHRFSSTVTYLNDREGQETTGDLLRSTDSPITVTIHIAGRTEGE